MNKSGICSHTFLMVEFCIVIRLLYIEVCVFLVPNSTPIPVIRTRRDPCFTVVKVLHVHHCNLVSNAQAY